MRRRCGWRSLCRLHAVLRQPGRSRARQRELRHLLQRTPRSRRHQVPRDHSSSDARRAHGSHCPHRVRWISGSVAQDQPRQRADDIRFGAREIWYRSEGCFGCFERNRVYYFHDQGGDYYFVWNHIANDSSCCTDDDRCRYDYDGCNRGCYDDCRTRPVSNCCDHLRCFCFCGLDQLFRCRNQPCCYCRFRATCEARLG